MTPNEANAVVAAAAARYAPGPISLASGARGARNVDAVERCSELIQLAGDGKPPTEFQLLANGETLTSKGILRCDDAHARLCLAHEMLPADGQLPLDYDHDMVDLFGTDKRAAGWFTLTNRGGALWATSVRFTPAAEKALRDREYRYFSPALFRDADGFVTRIINCALTNLPATIKQQPLVASQAVAAEAPSNSMTIPSAPTLTAEDRDACARFRIDPAAFAAERARGTTTLTALAPGESATDPNAKRVLTEEEKSAARLLKIPEERYLAMLRKAETDPVHVPPGGRK